MPGADLKDFPDALNPIVVKELRQGLRQKGFVVLFIFLQAIMAIVVFGALAGSSAEAFGTSQRAGQTVSGFFLTLFCVAALCVQPARGLSALAVEKREGSIDLLRLTKLSAWRITAGKWLALLGQTTLLLVAILPYLILRYYLGGMRLVDELLTLFTVFFASASLTAVTVGFSGVVSPVLRNLLNLAIWVPLLFTFLGFGGGMIFGNGPVDWLPVDIYSREGLLAYCGSLAVAGFTGYYFLEMGATHIAPPSENRSTRKRLAGLAMMGTVCLVFQDSPIAAWFVCSALACLLCTDALTESPDITASVTKPFVRFGLPGRLAGRVLYPGWPTGTVFTGLLSLGFLAACPWLASLAASSEPVETFFLAVFLSFGALIFPALLLARKRKSDPSGGLGAYVLVMLATFLVCAMLTTLAHALDVEESLAWAFVLCPVFGLFGLDEIMRHATTAAPLAACSYAAQWLALFLLGSRHRGRIRRLESPPQPDAPASAPSDA